MKLTFAKLLADYSESCIMIKQKLGKEHLTEADRRYLEGQRKQNFSDFQTMKHYIEDEDIFKCRNPTKHEIKKYKIEGNFPVVGILEYRDELIPVYNDDYGQQEFIIYKNKEISGGSYNYFPEYTWMYEIDSYLEKEFFDGPDIMPVYWDKLLKIVDNELIAEIEEHQTKRRK